MSSEIGSGFRGTVHVYCCGQWCGSFLTAEHAREWLSSRPECETWTVLDQSAHEELLAAASVR